MKHGNIILGTLGGLFVAGALVACGSDDSSGGSGSGGSTATGGSTSTGGATSTGGTSSTGGSTSTGGMGQGGGGGDVNQPSPECATYCNGANGVVQKCGSHLDNDSPFDDQADCLDQCAAQTTWDLACRTTHLGNSNGSDSHCYHAVGQMGYCADN
jgi:hypothetical protein